MESFIDPPLVLERYRFFRSLGYVAIAAYRIAKSDCDPSDTWEIDKYANGIGITGYVGAKRRDSKPPYAVTDNPKWSNWLWF